MKKIVTYCVLIGLALIALSALLRQWFGQPDQDRRQAQITVSLNNLPLSFEANQGQTDEAVKFHARGNGYGLFLTAGGATLALHGGGLNAERSPAAQMQMKLVNAAASPHIEPLDELPGRSNYLIGNDPRQWRTNIANYARVKYHDVYPGVDLIFYGAQRQLEYDFVLEPGADPRQIELAFAGAEQMSIDAGGDLVLSLKDGEVRQRKPVVYQEIGGARRNVEGDYAIRNPQSAIRNQTVSFEIGEYDPSQPLVIDPVLSYSSYLGGSGFDHGNAIAVDANGNIYVAGGTGSANFPGVNGAQRNFGGFFDGFIAKFNPGGTSLIYATYLGGNRQDACLSLAVDSSGSAFVTGITDSLNFPTASALQASYGGGDFDAFVAKLNPSGSTLTWSTYLGGNDDDQAYAIAVDSAGLAYVAGRTESLNFPKAQARQPAYGGGVDAFVTKFNAAGSALLYSSYLGGNEIEFGTGIAVDANSNIYVAGITDSLNFPTVQPLQANFGGGSADVFVTKLNADLASYGYSTYLGGSEDDRIAVPGNSIAVDQNGNVFLMGFTRSANFPVANALQLAFAGASDAFVTKLNPSGSALVYSTYLGGSDQENVGNDGFLNHDIAVDAAGNAYVIGTTRSTNFPLAHATQQSFGGLSDAFVAKLNATGSALVYSTYLGGSNHEDGLSIAVDAIGNAYVSGWTVSGNFPTAGASQPNYGGGETDAFVVRLNADAVTVSAASFSGAAIASKAIVAAFGPNLATTTALASSVPLPTTLAGTSVKIRDSAGAERAAPLFFVSQGQVNCQIPDGTAAGPASVTVTSGDGRVSSAVIQVVTAAPSLFTANASGSGAAAAVDAFTGATGPFNAKRANGEPNIISVFGTGLGADATDVDGNVSVEAKINGNAVTVLYAGRAPGFVGLNQFNVVFPASITSGVHTLTVARGGVASNSVTIAIR